MLNSWSFRTVCLVYDSRDSSGYDERKANRRLHPPLRRQFFDEADHLGMRGRLRVTELGDSVSLGKLVQFDEFADALAAG